MKKISSLIVALVCTASAHAAILDFNLIGTAGPGLLFGNEPAVGSGGTGGEIGAGIFFNDVTLQLTVNVGWGSSQGAFSDLTSTASASHIHGPTTANNGSGFTQTAGVLFTLTRSSSAVTGGTFTAPSSVITLTAAQQTDLFNGKYYINIHTATNSGGELRGFIVPAPVPEPATCGLVAVGALGLMGRRRKRVV